MDQMQLALLGLIDTARSVPLSELQQIRSYWGAVRMCFIHRRIQRMTQRMLCERTGMIPQHLSDYLHANPLDRNGKERRDMPTALY